jgi:hypothetical protein
MWDYITGYVSNQLLGKYYYLHACDPDDDATFPYRMWVWHKRCWWRGDPKGCISNATVEINTFPDPWIITVASYDIVEVPSYAYSHNNVFVF